MRYHDQISWLEKHGPSILGIDPDTLSTVAATPAVILIQGDCGTGKTALARLLHQHSPRAKRLFIPLHCAANPDLVSESNKANDIGIDLVDRVRGGTLFIREIGALSKLGQGRLLRLVDSYEIRGTGDNKPRRIDMRLIASTSCDLEALHREGKFLPELFYRFNVVHLRLPTLRRRPEKLPELAQHLLEDICREHKRPVLEIKAKALAALGDYHWPGNVRQLRNVLEQAVVFTPEDANIDADALKLPARASQPSPEQTEVESGIVKNDEDIDFRALSLEEYFQSFVIEHQGSMTENDLAKKLGISRKSLWERRRRLNIPRAGKASKEN